MTGVCAWKCEICGYVHQGTEPATIAVGGRAAFTGLPPSKCLKVMGIELFCIGKRTVDDGSYRFPKQPGCGPAGGLLGKSPGH